MGRTLTSKHDRHSLWIYYNGTCAICQEPLDSTWEADHIKPFRLTGETNVHDMQATCGPCNRKKGGSFNE
jgi:5-methylcytosine-specific restriction endonuclease McrA